MEGEGIPDLRCWIGYICRIYLEEYHEPVFLHFQQVYLVHWSIWFYLWHRRWKMISDQKIVWRDRRIFPNSVWAWVERTLIYFNKSGLKTKPSRKSSGLEQWLIYFNKSGLKTKPSRKSSGERVRSPLLFREGLVFRPSIQRLSYWLDETPHNSVLVTRATEIPAPLKSRRKFFWDDILDSRNILVVQKFLQVVLSSNEICSAVGPAVVRISS